MCVVCPWHKYIISLETGHSFYYDMQRAIKDKGPRQRTHHVRVRTTANCEREGEWDTEIGFRWLVARCTFGCRKRLAVRRSSRVTTTAPPLRRRSGAWVCLAEHDGYDGAVFRAESER